LDRRPGLAESLLVGVAVLDDQRLDRLRMPRRDPEPDRSAVVVHVEAEPLELQRIDQQRVDDLAEVVEGVGEFGRGRPRAVAEADQIGRDDPEPVGEPWDQIAKHVRRRREPVQQYDGWRVARAEIAVEDVEATNGFELVLFDHDGAPGWLTVS